MIWWPIPEQTEICPSFGQYNVSGENSYEGAGKSDLSLYVTTIRYLSKQKS